MRIALIFDKLRPDTLGGYVERACREEGIACDHEWTRHAERLPRSGYDLYLRIDHGDYIFDLPDDLHPKVFYASDTHLPKSWASIRRVAPRYELVCCVHRDGAERLPNGAWVPVACDPSLHWDPTAVAREDVAFVGTDGGVPRKFYLQALRERYPSSFIGLAPHTELGRRYGQAKIGFNYSIRHDINMRMFEVMAAGAMLLTNRLPHEDLARLGLRDGQHYTTYGDPRELWRQMEYYLSHDEERRAIAAAGRQHVHQHHTYRHRLRRILELAAQRLGRSGKPLEEGAVGCVS